MRVTSEIYVQALMRRARAHGAFATVVRRGAASAGAIFVVVRTRDATSLIAPAMAGWNVDFDADATSGRDDRRFALQEASGEASIDQRMKSEVRFDPDLWLIEIEDAEGRSFIDDAAMATE